MQHNSASCNKSQHNMQHNPKSLNTIQQHVTLPDIMQDNTVSWNMTQQQETLPTLREENKFGRKECGIKDCELDL